LSSTNSLTFKDHHITIVKRPRRRSTTLQVSRDNTITLIAPWNIKDRHIHDILSKNERWLEKKVKENNARPQKPSLALDTGCSLRYLGNTYTLRLQDGPRKIELDNHHLTLRHPKVLELSREEKQLLIEKWLKEQAKEDRKSVV